MTGLRWTTYDHRGRHWGSARVRVVALTVAFGLTAAGAVTAASTAGHAEDTTPPYTSDLSLLDQRHRAELEAIKRAYDRDVAALRAANDRSLRAVDQRLADDLDALDAAAAAADQARAAGLSSALDAVEARRAQNEADLHARFDRDESAVNTFFRDLLASLGPADTTPTAAALDAAKKALDARRSAELAAMDTAQKAETAALQEQLKAAVAALDQENVRLDGENHDRQDAIDAALAGAKSTVSAQTAAALKRLDADTVDLKAKQAQEQLDLDAVHAAQRKAAATSPKPEQDALLARQKSEDDDLHAQHTAELAAQAAARKGVQDDATAAVSALQTQHDNDRAAADTAYHAAKDAVAVQKATTTSDGNAELKALDDAHAVAQQALKNTYAAAITGLSKGQAGVRDAWTARLARLADDESKAVAALGDTADVERRKVRTSFDNRARAADRQLTADRRSRKQAAELQRGALERGLRAALLKARLDFARQVRLADSDYYTLKIRAVAFLQSPGSFTSVSAAFDPATDPGSIYNVARRIGATDLPSDVTGRGVDVALVDTGVVDVPGLAEANVQIGPDFSFEDVVPDLRGRDTMGHGTHLAGIIDGRDSAWAAGDHQRRADRFLGIAPDARLISIKAGAADGSVDVTQVIAAINWVIANRNTDGRNIRVLNLSFGTDGVQDYRIDPLAYAVERAWRAGIVVVAGGNDGWATSRLTNPAQDPFVIAVGSAQAVNGKESVPSAYSNGSDDGRTVDLAAPGRSIVSLRNPGSSSDEVNENGRTGDRFVRGSGTSQAAAVTSGAVALLLSKRPELTPDQVKYVLRASADPDAEDSALVGAGYLRIDKALKKEAPAAVQPWDPSTGTGSMDAARGSVRVVHDGVVLEGQMDIFGRDWSGAKWSDDSWSGAKWSSDSWSGAKWSGATWSTDMWSGLAWSGAKWSTGFWSGAKWSGAKWSDDSWSGAKWSGAKWSAGGWFGAGWDDGPSGVAETGTEPVSAEAEVLATTG